MGKPPAGRDGVGEKGLQSKPPRHGASVALQLPGCWVDSTPDPDPEPTAVLHRLQVRPHPSLLCLPPAIKVPAAPMHRLPCASKSGGSSAGAPLPPQPCIAGVGLGGASGHLGVDDGKRADCHLTSGDGVVWCMCVCVAGKGGCLMPRAHFSGEEKRQPLASAKACAYPVEINIP